MSLIKHHEMKALSFLISAPDEGECSILQSGCLPDMC